MTLRTNVAGLSVFVAMLAAFGILLAVYIVGYFCLCEYSAAYQFEDTWIRRYYRQSWLVEIYRPAARFESLVTGYDVRIHLLEIKKPISKDIPPLSTAY